MLAVSLTIDIDILTWLLSSCNDVVIMSHCHPKFSYVSASCDTCVRINMGNIGDHSSMMTSDVGGRCCCYQ